ncbi:MAG: FAD-dependent oxidoreductase [Thermomicrobiales bacterium]
MSETRRSSPEIAIVGGGIMGASLAWHLARRGVRGVTLLEQAVIANGASGKTGALLRRHYSNRPEAILAQRGWQTFAAWPEVVGGAPVHTPSGLIVTVDTSPGHEVNIARLHRNVALQNEIGIPSRVVTRRELQELQPQAVWDDISHGAYEPDSGYVDAIAATRSMAAAARAAGATVREGVKVLGVEIQGGRVSGVRTASGIIPAGVVVVAAGPWTPRVLAGSGVVAPIETLRVQIAVLQRPLAAEPEHMVYLDTAAGIFCRPWGPGRTMIGVGGGDQHDPTDPDAYEPRNDCGYADLAITAIARRMPAMRDAVYLHGHAGLYDMTPDAHPIIGPAGPDGLYLAAGFSGAGFKKGPAVGQALADLILDNGPDWVDLTPFRLERFAMAGWQQPWSENEYTFSSDFGHGL